MLPPRPPRRPNERRILTLRLDEESGDHQGSHALTINADHSMGAGRFRLAVRRNTAQDGRCCNIAGYNIGTARDRIRCVGGECVDSAPATSLNLPAIAWLSESNEHDRSLSTSKRSGAS